MIVHMYRQVCRGCGTLPHYGDHPGTLVLIVMCFAGLVAGGVAGLIIMLVVFGPVYFWGAYERAEDSDRYARRQRECTTLKPKNSTL